MRTIIGLHSQGELQIMGIEDWSIYNLNLTKSDQSFDNWGKSCSGLADKSTVSVYNAIEADCKTQLFPRLPSEPMQ